MSKVFDVIKSSIPTLSSEDLSVPLDQLSVDSIDLFDLRVHLDNAMGFEIPDSDWLAFTTFQDMVNFYERGGGHLHGSQEQKGSGKGKTRHFQINMPQMALEALSENWLLKELGDFHWEVLTTGLAVDSSRIEDEFGNRLYATFVRIRMENSHHLKHFKENEHLRMEASMQRYGNSMYFSDISIQGEQGKEIQARLMTTFSYRDSEDNKSLKKGQPFGVVNQIENQDVFPDFGQEYRLLRKGEKNDLVLLDEALELSDGKVFETIYQINPYQDLNGVNLLYFAAYPTINDVCESRFFNAHYGERIREHWAKEAYTLARDIFYLNNCDLSDSIRYVLHGLEFLNTQQVKISSSLYRESDGAPLAHIFTIKEMTT